MDRVPPHLFRKTVAALISEQVDSKTVSQQRGHSSSSITRGFYIVKPVIVADVAEVLQLLSGDPESLAGHRPRRRKHPIEFMRRFR